MTIKDLCENFNITQTELSKRFNIPLRTVQGWYLDERKPPEYVALMIAEALSRDSGASVYKYFCNCCGHKFESDLPDLNAYGFHNEIFCPHCGALDVYPGNKDGAAKSVANLNRYEAEILDFDS